MSAYDRVGRWVAAAAEPDVVALAVDGQALHRLFRAARRHSQVERVAVGVQSWFIDRPDCFDRQFALPHDLPITVCPTFCTTLVVSHSVCEAAS